MIRNPYQLYVLALGLLIGIVTNIATDQMPQWAQPYLWLCWPLLGILAIVFIVLQARSATPTPGDPLLVQIVPEPPKEEPKPRIAVPPAPYLAHPYPMPKHWTGRQTEMDELYAWLKGDESPMCCLIADGGTGKSSLSWAWLQKRVVKNQQALELDGIFQWSFYEGEVSFQRFLEVLGAYLGVSIASDPVTDIAQRLSEHRILLVLDGFERLLLMYGGADAALLPERPVEELKVGQRRCSDWATARFIRSLAAGGDTKTLLISRLVPEELDGREGWLPMDLRGLGPADAVTFLKTSGIKGTPPELEDAAGRYGFHPQSLSKLVNALHYDTQQPDDIRQALRYDVTLDLKANQKHILERAYDTLPHELAQFLGAIAALRGKPAMEVVRFLAGDSTDAELSANLRRLHEDRWVEWEPKSLSVDLHPLVRHYAYQRLHNKAAIHARLADYFRPLADAVNTEQVKSLGDLAPVIELYWHTVRAGRHDEAVQLFRDRINELAYYRFGAYQLQIELLRALFPDGEDRPPRLNKARAQAWTLNALANSYSLSGQPRRAVPLFEMHNVLQEKADEKKSLAIGLGNLAYMGQVPLGEVEAAEANVRRRIELCREIEHEFNEAIGHQELGQLLAYRGAFGEASGELDTALASFGKLGVTQGECIVWSYRALRALLMGEAAAALKAARRALEFWQKDAEEDYPVERDLIRVKWLVGCSLVALAAGENSGQEKRLTEAETHLTEALTRCRRINLVEVEPDILLAWARWHGVKGDVRQARECAEEALSIADRCEYRLVQADSHNFLARLDLEAGDRKSAVKHARIAYERAWCDGRPHCYKPALDEAEALLKELGESAPSIS